MNPKDEKWTPKKYLKSIRKVLGTVDLDPFSSIAANNRVKANRIFTVEEDGFKQQWFGRVFANPPYSRGNLNRAVDKIDYEWTTNFHFLEGIFLFPNSTDTKWFQYLWSFPLCFTDHRICFINGWTLRHTIEKNPENGSVFAYLGSHSHKFYEEFKQYGHIVFPKGD